MKSALLILLFTVSVPLFAIAAAGTPPEATTQPECQGEIATPLYMCSRTEPGVDIRLYVQEYQTCVQGRITSVDRTVSGLYAPDTLAVASGENIDASKITVVYAPVSTSIPNTYLTTMRLPTQATLKTSAGRFEMKMTTASAPDYDGAIDEESHYVGSYTRFAANGTALESGALACFVTP